MKILIYSANFAPEPTGIGASPTGINRVLHVLFFAITSLPLVEVDLAFNVGLLSNEFVRGVVLHLERFALVVSA